jgi:hypothetical protein
MVKVQNILLMNYKMKTFSIVASLSCYWIDPNPSSENDSA